MSNICGGVVSESKFLSNPELYMMAFVMPDDKYEKYIEYKKKGDKIWTDFLFKTYARSVI